MYEALEIATGRTIEVDERITSNVSGKDAFFNRAYFDGPVPFVNVQYVGELITRNVLAKNFGLRVRPTTHN